MTTPVKAIYEDGVFKPTEPVALKEKTEVQVLIPTEDQPIGQDPTGWQAIHEMIGSMSSGRHDASENHDEYLYGNRRRA
jgi:predicted DNA-binding antitoxin AbrB/MazE fold protein